MIRTSDAQTNDQDSKKVPTVEEVRALLRYEPETGNFYWRERVNCNPGWNRRYAGKLAGCKNPNGYVKIEISNQPFWAHRLAWLYVHGEWPSHGIDHRHRIKGDNRISELRLATQGQNMANASLRSDNTSGFKGVSRNGNIWVAEVWFKGKKVYLGCFDEVEHAAAAYRIGAAFLYGEFTHC